MPARELQHAISALLPVCASWLGLLKRVCGQRACRRIARCARMFALASVSALDAARPHEDIKAGAAGDQPVEVCVEVARPAIGDIVRIGGRRVSRLV